MSSVHPLAPNTPLSSRPSERQRARAGTHRSARYAVRWVPALASLGRDDSRADERTTSLLPPAHLVAGCLHGLDDVLIAGAATEIGRQHIQQILVADVGLL